MLYIGNTRYKVANKPYDAEIEYLKNNGKAYIDTGIKMHKWYGMGCTFAVTKHANSTWCIFCGSRTTFMYSLNWTVGSNGIITLVFDYLRGGSLGSGSTGLTYGDKMTFESRPDMSTMKMNAYFNGVYKSQTNIPTTDQAQTVNNWCFTSNNEWRTQESRIYEYWITDQTGKRIIDLIPVRKGNIGYMYDKISGKLFGKSGTGTFTLGPDINIRNCRVKTDSVIILPYISDGLVFHLDGADATDTTWVDRVAGVVFELTGATPNGKGVSFNTSRNTDKALHTTTIPSSITSVKATTGTIEVCACRTAVRNNYRECLYTTNRYSIQYVVESSGAHIALASSNGSSYVTPRCPLPNGRELKTFTHSCNAVRTCYNGTMITPGSNTYISMYNYCVGNNEQANLPFKGVIYQIRIYNRQLSEAEMKWNQEQDKNRYGIIF